MLECLRVKRILSLVLVSIGLGHTMMRSQQASNPAVEMCYSGMKMAKPPLKYLHFQVTLRNIAAGSRWFIFPAAFYQTSASGPKNAGIFAAEVFSDSEHKIMLVDLLGTYRSQPDSAGGLKAVLLPANGVITLRDFQLSFWGDDPSHFSVHVQIAGELKIGSVPLESWVGTKLLSASSADAGDLKMIASKRTPNSAELPVEINQAEEFVIEQPAARDCLAK
jgi:hypothetical protein